MDTSHPSPAAPPAAFVRELLRCIGALMLVVDHMARYSASESAAQKDVEPFDVVLAGLLHELLSDELSRLGDAGVAVATALLAHTAETVGNELFLVPPPNRAARRRKRAPTAAARPLTGRYPTSRVGASPQSCSRR